MDQTRKSLNSFDNVDEENAVLIYNYPTNFTALVKSAYEQCYLFYESTDYKQIGNESSNEPNTACSHSIYSGLLALIIAYYSIIAY